MKLPFDNTYARLPDRFHARVSPARVRAPRIVKVNRALAEVLGLDAEQLASAEGAEVLAGNALAEGAEPIALAYAGHQFGSFVSQLGDGRAILLGEVVGRDGKRRDLQLKGAGRTPFSRGGDGRAALGPVLREYVVSEAMAALGVPTTRALAAVTTGEPVYREEVLPGAVLTRVAASHIRVGTFQFFAARGDREALATLASYALSRHYPEAVGSGNDALALLERVVDAQATLVARWLGVGFVHGVMNTDNTSISGETIDYGPCAFLDEYDPAKKFSSIDRGGRYAFGNQPRIAQWNMARLAEALLPLLAEGEEESIRLATERVERFSALFVAAHERVLRAKLGLAREEEGDLALAADLLERLASNGVDYTVFFRRLCASAADPAADTQVAALFAEPGAFRDWAESWRRRLAREDVDGEARASAMRLVNPAFIPRNHRIEALIQAAVLRDDFEPFETLVRVLGRPYDDQPESAHLGEPPQLDERVQYTFCGT
ncbi:protein adenylyltransferase SelO [Sorangium atrum]|uniref:Protein nucleotidyltransferase YdiU n=1 Tax=Sorangium atrum TaxID=2995308 RepID=A0ABT5BTU2_9BACT|nr:YdiU family protein [Sorangium aterium]MDC0677581.1 YdiU family protein [Sorangium aterium]